MYLTSKILDLSNDAYADTTNQRKYVISFKHFQRRKGLDIVEARKSKFHVISINKGSRGKLKFIVYLFYNV